MNVLFQAASEFLVPTPLCVNAYGCANINGCSVMEIGMHSHAGAWEREKKFLGRYGHEGKSGKDMKYYFDTSALVRIYHDELGIPQNCYFSVITILGISVSR